MHHRHRRRIKIAAGLNASYSNVCCLLLVLARHRVSVIMLLLIGRLSSTHLLYQRLSEKPRIWLGAYMRVSCTFI